MNYYIATTLTNAPRAQLLADYMAALGHACSYAWFAHGNVGAGGEGRLAEVAVLEMEGVRNSDVVIALLPGGRGTHIELGAAIALGKPVLLIDESDIGFRADESTCAFYWHPLVYRYAGSLDELVHLQVVGFHAAELVHQREAGTFGSGRYGHTAALAAVLERPLANFPLVAVVKRSGLALSAYVQGVSGCAVTGPTLPTVLGRLGQAVEQQLAEAV